VAKPKVSGFAGTVKVKNITDISTKEDAGRVT